MLVSHVLKSKSNDAVFTSPPTLKVAQAAKTLADKRIGTLVISSDGKSPDGILSERDIVRALGQSGGACLDTTVDTLMTRKVVTCTATDAAEVVLQQMTDGRFRHMPVLEDGQIVGVISLGDVVKARLTELAMEKNALEGMIMGH